MRRVVVTLAALAVLSITGLAAFVTYAYATTPAAVRKPQLEHYHLRLQTIVDGKAVNFAGPNFQTAYDKGSCSAEIPKEPFHFHDGASQFAHVHWEGMTGGLLLKYYGWDFVGGSDDVLGRKFDGLRPGAAVPIHGKELGRQPATSRVFVFTGDADGFKQREFADWLNQDFEVFFNKTSSSPAHEANKQSAVRRLLLPAASAAIAPSEADKEELNNLLGNAVLFAQDERPTDADVQARFDMLEPLPTSVCSG